MAPGFEAVMSSSVPLALVRTEETLDATGIGAALRELTGHADAPGLPPPPGLVPGLERLAQDIGRLSAEMGEAVDIELEELLTTRARLSGLNRHGRVSANSTCRLLRGPVGWIAVNLARQEDVAAVPAVAERDGEEDPWRSLQDALDRSSVDALVSRARLLGLPASPLGPAGAGHSPPWVIQRLWPTTRQMSLSTLRVVDLSSMWAGPLTAHLLARAGAQVVKVESATRPDGARATPAFYRTLHADDQELATIDFRTDSGRQRLHSMLDEADVVIESSRPRALEQLGTGPGAMTARPGKVWISITGYGRDGPGRDWVAFGDDAAVAGGLVATDQGGDPVFCGDALADPVTGMTAAAAALEALATGGGVLLDVSMQACSAALTG